MVTNVTNHLAVYSQATPGYFHLQNLTILRLNGQGNTTVTNVNWSKYYENITVLFHSLFVFLTQHSQPHFPGGQPQEIWFPPVQYRPEHVLGGCPG